MVWSLDKSSTETLHVLQRVLYGERTMSPGKVYSKGGVTRVHLHIEKVATNTMKIISSEVLRMFSATELALAEGHSCSRKVL